MSTVDMEQASVETDFVSVKSKKAKSRKRKREEKQELEQVDASSSTNQTSHAMDLGESQPTPNKRPSFPPISGDKLKVIVIL
jgi:hypothetical protein